MDKLKHIGEIEGRFFLLQQPPSQPVVAVAWDGGQAGTALDGDGAREGLPIPGALPGTAEKALKVLPPFSALRKGSTCTPGSVG